MQGAMVLKLWVALVALQAWLWQGQASAGREITAYEELERNGFPKGLLPHTVVDYTLQSNGKFAVHLAGKCTYTIPGEKLPVSYADTITGVLQYGKLKDLGGIQVKVYFVWLTITSIEVSNDNLVFSVGILSAKYPISNFDEGPECDAKAVRPVLIEPLRLLLQ